MMANPKCMLLGDPGTGKTPPVCVMQWWLWTEKRIRTVWIMPKSLLKKNKDEIHTFTGFTDSQVVIVDGTPKKVKAALESKDAVVFLMGFDRHARSWRELPKDVKAIHIDEFHMGYKSDGSKRTQELYAHADRCEYFVPMTGTLIDGRLDTAYPAIRVIEPRYYASHEAFMHYHAFLDEYDRPIWWKNHEKLSEILGRHGIRRTFESVYGASKSVIIPEVVHMSEKHRALYDPLHETAFLELETFFVDGSMPGVHFIRTRQLMEHPNFFPDPTKLGMPTDVLKGEEPAKLERLRVLLEDHIRTGKPVGIFSSLIPQQKQVAKVLDEMGIKYGLLNGETSTKKRGEIDAAFRAGKIQVILASPAVASVGFNWQFSGGKEVDHVIFMALDFMDTSFAQAIRRFERDTRKTSLRITVMQYADSVDARVLDIVKSKSKLANMVDPTRTVFDLAA